MKKQTIRDYSLQGEEGTKAIQKGLAEAIWYTTPIPREKMKELLVRKNGPAIRDTLIWFSLVFGFGYLFYITWGHWFCVFPYIIYSALYASTSDARWHESCHGTAFKSDWLNNVLYVIASFMVFRQSVPWRWSHFRHHSDTIIIGRDPEVAVPRPANFWDIFFQFAALKNPRIEFRKIVLHSFGKIDPEVAMYLPKTEFNKVFIRARIYLIIYALVIVLAIVSHSILPLMYIGISTLVGSWLMVVYYLTQHAGLAEDVLDHRLNCRTVYMNRINRFLYWNMNYHIEHHMFPLVPYHALPKLHDMIKNDCPKPYNGLIDAYREIIPTLIKQSKDPYYFLRRELPTGSPKKESPNNSKHHIVGNPNSLKDSWVEVCPSNSLSVGDIFRFDLGDSTYAIYCTATSQYYATDGLCTHANTHLSDGLIIDDQIECPKHNGRFCITDGSVKRQPVCIALKTYEIKIKDSMLMLNVQKPGGLGVKEEEESTTVFKVISNRIVATFITELTLEPILNKKFIYKPGEYIQLEIPHYEISFKYFDIGNPFRKKWIEHLVFRNYVKNTTKTRRNYSFATNPASDKYVVFNVRLALPPEGLNVSAGVGSSYVYSLKPGDIVKAIGPFGDFHIKDTDREMVYIGGGSGMAPLRSHIAYLFEYLKTDRKVSFWYGARSKKDLFYVDFFENLVQENKNFSFHIALSEPEPDDHWKSHTGFIHEVAKREYLDKCPDASGFEYYLCGPPEMITSTIRMLTTQLNVDKELIAFDEF
jgi:Na+-transporting NADH:ubiquinone oxidoreductase subunit F